MSTALLTLSCSAGLTTDQPESTSASNTATTGSSQLSATAVEPPSVSASSVATATPNPAATSPSSTNPAATSPASTVTSTPKTSTTASTSAEISAAEVSPLSPGPSDSAVPSSIAAPTTEPDPAEPLPAGLITTQDRARARKIVATMTVSEQAGAVLMVHGAKAIRSSLISDLHLGGVILMAPNRVVDGTADGSPAQVLAVTSALQQQVQDAYPGFPLLIATDQEFGLVMRLRNGFTRFPAANDYTRADLATATTLLTQASAAAGKEMLAVGINVNFAPVSDLLPNQSAAYDGSSAIGNRSYGSDPTATGQLVASAVTGYQSAGVAATLKHFPGLGSLTTDTHDALPTLTMSCSEWNSTARLPLAAGIKAGTALVMTGHALMPAASTSDTPASLSAELVTNLLRGNGIAGCTGLEFPGVSVTDAMEMAPIVNTYGSAEAAWRAIAAGEDLVLMSADPAAAHQGIVDAVGNGDLSSAQLAAAAERVMALRSALGRATTPDLSVVNSPVHQQLAAEISVALSK